MKRRNKKKAKNDRNKLNKLNESFDEDNVLNAAIEVNKQDSLQKEKEMKLELFRTLDSSELIFRNF